MQSIATNAVSTTICWTWNFGAGLSDAESSKLLQLGALQAQGKLAAAAAPCQVSYRSAWGLLKRYEHHFGQAAGDQGPGQGHRLSDFGERLLALDNAARANLEAFHAPWGQRLKELLSRSEAAEPECLHIAASHDLALADWIENGRRVKVDIRWRGSEEALTRAGARRVRCGRAFTSPANSAVPRPPRGSAAGSTGDSMHFFPVMRREHGMLTAPGNPFAVTFAGRRRKAPACA
jgi:molybdate transport repressor ModE-like protein